MPAFTLVLPGKACPVMSPAPHLRPPPRACGKCSPPDEALPDTSPGRCAFLPPVPVQSLGPAGAWDVEAEIPPSYVFAVGTNTEFYIRFQQKGALWYLSEISWCVWTWTVELESNFLLLMLTNFEIRYKKTKSTVQVIKTAVYWEPGICQKCKTYFKNALGYSRMKKVALSPTA